MEFVGAFLVCAFLCVAVQLFCELVPRAEGPTVFLFVAMLGAILAPLPIAAALNGLGNAGLVITFLNVGIGVFGGVSTALAGNPVPLLMLLGVFCAVAVVGLITGAVCDHRRKR